MSKTRKCIFCLRTQEHFSREHLIPDVLMGAVDDKALITDAVCINCNTYFGRTIDAAFLNNDLVKLLRLRHKRFLPTNKLPSFNKASIKQLVDSEGNKYKLDSVVDNSGSRYEPSPKPNEQLDRKTTTYVRNYSDAIRLVEKHKKKRNIKVTIEPLMPKRALNGPVELPIDGRLPSLDILYKMFIEFVYLEYGRQHAIEQTFDQLRKTLLQQNYYLGKEYKWKMSLSLPLTILIRERTEITNVTHTIGIIPEQAFWCFFFNMFGEVTFYCSIPDVPWYTSIIRKINFKTNIEK